MSGRRRHRALRWARLSLLIWRASPLRCVLISLTFAVDIAGQPLIAFMLRDFTNAVLNGDRSAAVRAAAIAATLWSISDQGAGVRNLLRNDLRERVGLALSERRLELVSNIPSVAHLEDPYALDQIHVGENGQQVADVVCAAAESIANILAVVATLLVLSAVSPWLMLMLPLAVPTLWFNRIGQAAVRTAMNQASQSQRIADRLLESVLAPESAAELRITGAGHVLLEEYERRWTAASTLVLRAKYRAAGWLAAGWLLFLIGFGGGLAYLVWSIEHGRGSPGDIIFMLAIARQQQQLVQQTVQRFRKMLEGLQVADAHFWLHDEAAKTTRKDSRSDAQVPARLASGITLSRVRFTYPGTGRSVLDDIDLHLRAGTMVALVGPHGSGKTSLTKLLTRLYRPTAGRIQVDGSDLDSFGAEEWRSRTSAAFQDFVRFETRARESVGVGDLPRSSDPRHVQRAIDHGGAREVIAGLPKGLDTQLGLTFGGVDLSGGQWQKLALARACMRQDPLLLVLDEPTASLDPISEYEIFRRQLTIARTMAALHGTVTVVVSHRFSTVRMADEIVVLSNGSIAERGSHDALMNMNGMYAGMYRLQQNSYITPTTG
jgi:ATP-binding cassette subfamily B protein